MQANSIWAGNDYAYLPNSSRNERFSLACHRVKALRQISELAFAGAKRSTTWVDVHFLDKDTGEEIEFQPSWRDASVIKKNDDGSFRVRAYDFVEFWEQVEDQYKHLVRKQKAAEEERERAAEERRQELKRHEAARVARLDGIRAFLVSRGLDESWIKHIDVMYGSVALNLNLIEQAIQEGSHDTSIV